jgi:hypothetical protein
MELEYKEFEHHQTQPVSWSSAASIQASAFASMVDHYKTPASRTVLARKNLFDQLVTEWKDATLLMSSLTEIVTNPSYQRIIGMGLSAVPFILSELNDGIEHWHYALCAITGSNPVRDDDLGNLPKMRLAWLDWAQNQK